MMPKKILLFFLALSLSLGVVAQLPRTNIYLFDVKQGDDGKLAFQSPRFLTDFNRNGYNGDPSFFSNTELYISVKRPGDTQTDLFRLDLAKKAKQRVTETPEDEFAPERMPEYYTFSAIRVERQGRDSVYRLWQFPVNQLVDGKPVFKYLTGIKSYFWLNSQEIVVYKEEEPSTLSIVNTTNDEITTIATNVGHVFNRLPNGNLAFIQKSRYEDWKIMEKNLYRRKEAPRTLIETLPGAEHFAILPDGTLLMGKGSKLYKYNKFIDDTWKEAADLRFYEIRNIYDLEVSPDFKLAIVAD
ncbi:MAG: hypothetical protein KDD19_30250 [Phaeodactylibacter sp.]|nr:hypothetical protein [Phaeodactylibacter sp.]MCB9052083.1 hypothetical protein [Lewinellaceae bacterium]